MEHNQFQRTEMLLGPAAMEKLAQAHVAVFGLGGVGSYVVEALARSGVGSLTLVDHDVIDYSNLNRQLFALHSTLGQPKTSVAADRVRDINPQCNVTEHRKFYLSENAESFDLSPYTYIVDAVDTVTAKLELAARAAQLSIPIISSMGTGNKLDPCHFYVTDIYNTDTCPLARVMRRELKKRGVSRLQVVCSHEAPIHPAASDSRTPGSIAYVPSSAGLIIAGVVIRSIADA